WANFYAHAVSTAVFNRMDTKLYSQLRRWAHRRHPTKPHQWIQRRYWITIGRRRWVFGRYDEAKLRKHADTHIVRHTKVRGSKTPYDGDLLYWARRLGHHPELPTSKAALLKRQHGRCAWCGLLFVTMDDVMEVDHKVPRARGGSSMPHNRQ